MAMSISMTLCLKLNNPHVIARLPAVSLPDLIGQFVIDSRVKRGNDIGGGRELTPVILNLFQDL